MIKTKGNVFTYLALILFMRSTSVSSLNGGKEFLVASVSEKEASSLMTEDTKCDQKKNKNVFVQVGNYVRDSVVRFKDGTIELYTNHQKCNDIRSKQKAFQELHYPNTKQRSNMKKRGITYEEFDFLEKQKLDRNKVGNMIFLMFFAPNVLPYAIMGFPDILPSPFCIPSGNNDIQNSQEIRWESMSRTRAHACIRTLIDIEKLSNNDPRDSTPSLIPFGRKRAIKTFENMKFASLLITSFLGSKQKTMTEKHERSEKNKNNNHSSNHSNSILNEEQSINALKSKIYTFDEPSKDKRQLVNVPKPIIKGISSTMPRKTSSFVENFTPHFLTRNQVLQHIRKISEADEFLMNEDINLSILPRELLMEICYDRCIGTPASSKEELCTALSNWLEFAVVQPSAKSCIQYPGNGSSFPTLKQMQRLKKEGVLVLQDEEEQIEYFNANFARVVLMCRNAAESVRDNRCSSILPRLLF